MKSVLRTVLALMLMSAAAGFAQGNITNGNAEFRRTLTPFDTTPTADFVGVSSTLTQDHLFETGWWYRVAGDTQEFNFPVPDSQSYVGDTSEIIWNDVGGRGLFSASESSRVNDLSGFYGYASGLVHMTMVITNLSPSSPLDLELFHVADFDVNGAANDSASLTQWSPYPIIEITDPSGNFAQYFPQGGWTGYMVTAFGAGDVPAQLSDASITNFANTGLPFGPGDFVGGWHYSLSIPPDENRGRTASLLVNVWSNCSHLLGILCDGFESGNTSIWSVVVP